MRSSVVESGAIAERCGGCVAPTNICMIPGYEMPTVRCVRAHGCAAIVSTAS